MLKCGRQSAAIGTRSTISIDRWSARRLGIGKAIGDWQSERGWAYAADHGSLLYHMYYSFWTHMSLQRKYMLNLEIIVQYNFWMPILSNIIQNYSKRFRQIVRNVSFLWCFYNNLSSHFCFATSTHPLALRIREKEQMGIVITAIKVGNLSSHNVTSLVAEALGMEDDEKYVLSTKFWNFMGTMRIFR